MRETDNKYLYLPWTEKVLEDAGTTIKDVWPIILDTNIFYVQKTENQIKLLSEDYPTLLINTADHKSNTFISMKLYQGDVYNATNKEIPANVCRIPLSQLINRPADENEIRLLNDVNFKKAENYLIVGDTIRSRLQGKLPVLDIAGDKYFVDMRLRHTYLTDDWSHGHSFYSFLDYEYEKTLYGIYDTKLRQLLVVNNETEPNPDWIAFKLKDFRYIDPIGLANADYKPALAYIHKYKMIDEPAAQLIPLSKLYVYPLINENRLRAGLPPLVNGKVKQTKAEQIKKQTPVMRSTRKRKGKGL